MEINQGKSDELRKYFEDQGARPGSLAQIQALRNAGIPELLNVEACARRLMRAHLEVEFARQALAEALGMDPKSF